MYGAGTGVSAQNRCMIGTNFTRPAWKAQNDMFANYTSVTGDNPWNPQFLEDCTIYGCIRNMDADHINGSSRSQWTQRPLKTDRNQSPIAYEWFIDMCNRVGADLWICVPHLTVNRTHAGTPSDYAIRLVILLTTGVDMKNVSLGDLNALSRKTEADFTAMGGVKVCEPLKPELKIYLEYSNETWNESPFFSQSQYCVAEAGALNLGGNKPGARFHGWAAIRVFRGAELVLGVGSPRLVKVLAGFTMDMSHFGDQLYVVNSEELNPWKTTVNAISTAPYIGHNATTVAGVRAELPQAKTQAYLARRVANQTGLKLFAYEAGQHVLSNCIAVNSDPEMYGIYREYLDTLSRYFDCIAHFSQVGIWGGSGCWGAKQYTGQPLAEAHKYRAIVDWVSANPYVPTAVTHEQRTAFRPNVTAVLTTGTRCYSIAGRLLDARGRTGGSPVIMYVTRDTGGPAVSQRVTGRTLAW